MLCLILLVSLCVTAADTSSGSYFITASKYLQRGMPYNVSIDILNTTDTVHVQASIQVLWYNNTNTYRTPLASAQGDFTKGKTGILSIQVPHHIFNGPYIIHVRGSNALNFEREKPLGFWNKTISIMVQTDKAMYKPGQKVHFRVLGVYRNLQVYQGKFDIFLRDPNTFSLKEWIGLDGSTGVVEGEFQLADMPPLGDWSIIVHTEENFYDKGITFTVANYQLPRFEVKVFLPPFALTSDHMLVGTVKTTYTFGKKVKGMVELHVHMDTGSESCGKPPKYTELAFPIDGETKFNIPIGDIKRLQFYLTEKTVVVDAYVKEELTGVKLMGSSSIKFHTHPYKIDVLSSSPKTFSPTLPYTAYIKVSQQDNRPVTDVASPVQIYTCVHYQLFQDDQHEYGCYSFTGTYGLPAKNYTIPQSGIIPIDMRIPENATKIDVKVHYKDISDTLTVKKKRSNSNNYIQLKLVNKQLRAGQTATFTVEYTDTQVTTFSYEVLSRGTIDITGQFSAGKQNPVTFTVPISATMAPVAHIIAYYIRPSTEVVADSLAFSVEDAFNNKVSVSFSRNESKSHENVDILLTADPQSSVNLLAVDQSVLLQESGNDITTYRVMTELRYYSGGIHAYFSPEVFAISSSSTDGKVFSDAGLEVITDAYNTHCPIITATGDVRPCIWPHFYTPHPTAKPYPIGIKVPGLKGSSLKERMRQNFPETWLWMSQTVGASGKATVNAIVPDTITSWVASAFAVNTVSGLGVAATTTKLRVFRSFFVSLSMPSSVLRGEELVIQASVFNYLSDDVDVEVSLPTSIDYINIHVDSTGATHQELNDQNQLVTVKSNEAKTVYFPIIPATLGSIDIRVSARTTVAADVVRRQLVVLSEGIPKEYTVPIFIDVTQGGSNFNEQVSVSLPAETISGSQKARVKVTGDLIGSSLENLESLLSMPTGCGEQNMMGFAPDVYIADYLTITKQMTPALESRITNYLELGYQSELTYRQSVSSFNAFGNRDEAGSMWLTAFVARTFHQARPYIFIGNYTIDYMRSWMAKRQNEDGSFKEPGIVLDRQMQKSPATLTAMVLLAFLENQDMSVDEIDKYTYGNVTLNATKYLERVAPALSNPFELAVVSYALSLAGSSVADNLFIKLNAAAKVHGSFKHWTEPISTTSYYTKWSPPHVAARPIDIQTTAYALLASSARGDFKGGLPITNWLTSQKNPYGGFSSTQDTIVALQALTDYARRTHSSAFHVQLDISAGNYSEHLSVNNQNALVLQSREFPTFPTSVSVAASGKGVVYAEVDVFYHVEAEIGEPSFSVDTVLLDDAINNFRLMTCTKWLKQGSSGMAVMEISIPSGFAPDLSTIKNVAGIKRSEIRGRNVVVYFDQIGTTSLCFDFLCTRAEMVVNHQKSYITIYDYYQPSNQASILYETRSLRKATLCDVCLNCCP